MAKLSGKIPRQAPAVEKRKLRLWKAACESIGFQHVGDQIWAAADQRANGFLLGATAACTTLGGVRLQHQDGSSHLVASTVPHCKAYDPAFAGEMAVIVDAGMREMLVEQRDVFYCVTLMNENYARPSLPADVYADVLRGGYRSGRHRPNTAPSRSTQAVTLLGSGAILTEVIKATAQLAAECIDAEVFSINGWSGLTRDGAACEAAALRGEAATTPFIARQLQGSAGQIVAATDCVRAVPESVRAYLPEGRRYLTLGTDGFGRSDTRAALRRHFGVDAASMSVISQFDGPMIKVGDGCLEHRDARSSAKASLAVESPASALPQRINRAARPVLTC